MSSHVKLPEGFSFNPVSRPAQTQEQSPEHD